MALVNEKVSSSGDKNKLKKSFINVFYKKKIKKIFPQ